MSFSNSDLVKMFPAALRQDALKLASALPNVALASDTFSVEIGSEIVQIPYRVYHDPAFIHSSHLTPTQNELLACVLTRHHSGFVREEHLARILDSKHEWVPPFVVQLVGEYVFEITRSIRDNLGRLDSELYREFLTRNPAFYQRTKERVMSYWNCYYRGQPEAEYPGFQVLEFLDRLI
jgi:hypothetical protein